MPGIAKAARDEFLKVLDEDPNEKLAVPSLASLASTKCPASRWTRR